VKSASIEDRQVCPSPYYCAILRTAMPTPGANPPHGSQILAAVGTKSEPGGRVFRGTVFHSRNGGQNWSTPFLDEQLTLKSVFSTPQGMTAVGEYAANGSIVSCGNDDQCTTQHLNGGYLNSISGSADGKSLWAVGYQGEMWYYNEGKWLHLTTPTQETLRAVFATRNGKRIFAVGDYGTILRSDNGHDWRIQPSPTNADLSSVFFTEDGMKGWMVGDYSSMDSRVRPGDRSGAKILQTTDGGEHWAERSVSGSPKTVFGTADAKALWIGGGVSWQAQSTEKPATYLKAARLTGTPEKATLALELGATPVDRNDVHISLAALNDFKYTRHLAPQSNFKYTFGGSGNETDTWVAAFDPSDLEISSGTIAHFYINLSAGGYSQVYEFGARYDPWRWFIDHRAEVGTIAGLIAVFTTLYLFLIFKPLWNLWIYLALKKSPLDRLFRVPLAGPVLEFLFSICTFGLPWFVTRKRTLDAWVAAHRTSITEQWGRETLSSSASAPSQQSAIDATPYIPLPMQVQDPHVGEIISQPASDKISKFFGARRTVIEVVGPGGAGKTTFARQCGLWALEGGRPGGLLGHAMIPVWIDEEISNNRPLAQIVRDKLVALLPDASMDDSFLDALLKKQRLLIIIDRLSEKSATTRQYIAGVYSSTRAEAMLITSRVFLSITGANPTTLFPQALDEHTLLYFMHALLQPSRSEDSLEAKGSRSGISIDDQLALAMKLRDFYRNSIGAETNILPLPVRLFVEEAKHLIDTSQSLDALPLSVPEIYAGYLEQINPDNPSVPNFMSQTEMHRAAMVLAKLALADDFIPKEFDGSDANDELRRSGRDLQKLDPVQRLLDNGVLTSKGPLISRRLKFALDPVAEHLAAVAHFRENRHDSTALQEIRNQAKAAPGFLRAFYLISKSSEEPAG
jgi:photosystem II stability/assembly factor-like uncharacterized protein